MTKKPPRIIEHYEGEVDFVCQEKSELFGEYKIGLVVDVETTGLNFANDSIIEIGLVLFEYDGETGDIISVNDKQNFLQDPGKPLSPEIIKLTGLTDQALNGQEIDVKKVNALFDQSEIVIAHNAFFDRNFINKKFISSREKLWACSKDDIPWRDLGHSCRTLQHLCNDFLFYYDGHRAEIDCLAVLKLLSKKDHIEGNTIFTYLLKTSLKKSYVINAIKAPFESKDILKEAGYRWNPEQKFWYKKVTEDELEENRKLLSTVYRSSTSKPDIIEINLNDRFLNG